MKYIKSLKGIFERGEPKSGRIYLSENGFVWKKYGRYTDYAQLIEVAKNMEELCGYKVLIVVD